MNLLKDLCVQDGILVDDFADVNFRHKHEMKPDQWSYLPPYSSSWIACLHNPPNVPLWWKKHRSNGDYAGLDLFDIDLWIHSLPYLRGIICFSHYHKRWLEHRSAVPVLSLRHPGFVPGRKFSMDEFRQTQNKRIVQIGWWLRRMRSIYDLHAPGFVKTRIHHDQAWIQEYYEEESKSIGPRISTDSVEILPFLSCHEYDLLLASSIIFLDLYDASANNTVIEAIFRNTPILVNRVGGVVDYLGSDYPLYFQNLDDAAAKIQNEELIYEAHFYLKNLSSKSNLSGGFFQRSLVESELYQGL